MRLRTKFVLVLVSVAAVLGAGVFVGFDHVRDQSVDRAQASVDETAAMAAAQVGAEVRDQRSVLARAAARPAAERFDHTEAFLDPFLQRSAFHTARVVAANGTTIDLRGDVSAATRESELGADVGDRPHVASALAGDTAVSDVTCDPTCAFTVAAPIYDGTEVKGALAATVTLDDAGVFAPVAPAESGDRTVRVTDSDGTVVHESAVAFDDPITGAATVETTGWTVTVAQSRRALADRLQSLLYVEASSLLLVFGVVLALGGWEYRTTLAQTDRLLDGFDALQRGDYDRDLSLSAAREWRQVSDGFNELADGLREREERLQILNRVLRHNLRNDLAVVTGNAERIVDATDDPEVVEACETILAAGSRLNDRGDTAREIESVMAEPATSRERVDVAAELRETVASLREDDPTVDADVDVPASLEAAVPPGTVLAFEHLCRNAFQYTGDDAHVRVAAERQSAADGDSVVVTVADDGPGIPKQDREAVEAGEETPLKHGSGLGLWFVHWLAERADGDFDIADNEPTGTVVTLSIPVE
ncbi:MAG: sensor histidine kinase [Halobacterium sp.]